MTSAAEHNDDMTPDEARLPLLAAMMVHVPFDGWTKRALDQAAADVGVTPEFAELAFPGGAEDVLDLHLKIADGKMMTALDALDLPSMKIRDRITTAIRVRLEQNVEHREAIRRGQSLLALPPNVGAGAKALWRMCDLMWQAAGDTSTDHNWYTKRMILAGVYLTTLSIWLDDDSEGFAETWAFLDRRIDNVMQIEKAKWEIRKVTETMPGIGRFLGRLRYGDPKS